MKTKEEILEEVIGFTFEYIKDHPDCAFFDDYLLAMELYAKQYKNPDPTDLDNIKSRIIELLCEEYPLVEAIEQVETGFIKVNDTFIRITYDNGYYDDLIFNGSGVLQWKI